MIPASKVKLHFTINFDYIFQESIKSRDKMKRKHGKQGKIKGIYHKTLTRFVTEERPCLGQRTMQHHCAHEYFIGTCTIINAEVCLQVLYDAFFKNKCAGNAGGVDIFYEYVQTYEGHAKRNYILLTHLIGMNKSYNYFVDNLKIVLS